MAFRKNSDDSRSPMTVEPHKAFALIAVVTFAVVFAQCRNCLNFGYHCADDTFYSTAFPPITWHGLYRILFSYPGYGYGCYRPVWCIYIAIMERLGLGTALSFHVMAAIFHAVNILLAMALVLRIWKDSTAALLTGAAFLCYPAGVDTIRWFNAHEALIFTTFYLAAIHLWLTWRRSGRPIAYIGALVCTILAFFTKEEACTLPFVLLSLELLVCRQANERRITWRAAIPFAISLVVAIACFHVGLHRLFHGTGAWHRNVIRQPSNEIRRLQIFCGIITLGAVGVAGLYAPLWLATLSVIARSLRSIAGPDNRMLWLATFLVMASLPVPLTTPSSLSEPWYSYLPGMLLSMTVGVVASSLLKRYRDQESSWGLTLLITCLASLRLIPLDTGNGLVGSGMIGIVMIGIGYISWRSHALDKTWSLLLPALYVWSVAGPAILLNAPAHAYIPMLYGIPVLAGAVATRRQGWWQGALVGAVLVNSYSIAVFMAVLAAMRVLARRNRPDSTSPRPGGPEPVTVGASSA